MYIISVIEPHFKKLKIKLEMFHLKILNHFLPTCKKGLTEKSRNLLSPSENTAFV